MKLLPNEEVLLMRDLLLSKLWDGLKSHWEIDLALHSNEKEVRMGSSD